MVDFLIPLVVLPSLTCALLIVLGDGSLTKGVREIWDEFVNIVEALWLLLTVPMQRREPLEADPDKIRELQQWNWEWQHPALELGEFYLWIDGRWQEQFRPKKEPEYQAESRGSESYDYTPGPGRVWSVPKGMTLGSWCRSCQSPAHGAEYCRRCVDNYGYREGKKRYKLPNGCYVDTYEETLCEVCKEPLPLYWSRICSAECGGKLEELEETRCKDTMCGGYGTVYRLGLCKGCCTVRMRDRCCSWCGKTGGQLWNDGKRYYCNDGCRERYYTEP